MSELELTFHVRPEQRAELLKALGNRKLERVPLLTSDVDTADGLLARHHFALCVRREGVRWLQTLKEPAPAMEERVEHNVDLDATSGDGKIPTPDPERHRGTPAGDRLLRLLDGHDRPRLVEVVVTDVARIRRLLHVYGASIEWALDEGTVRAGDAVATISELKLKLKSAPRQALYAAALDWQGRHGLWLDATSESERGRLLAGGLAHRPPERASVPDWTRGGAKRLGGSAMLRRFVSACLAQVVPNATELARGSGDPGHVHQMRVGLRRLRSVVREMAPHAAGLDGEWEAPVMRVFEALGSLRDRQVADSSLARELRAAGAPVFALTETTEDVTLASLGELVRAAPFQSALLQLLAFSEERENRTVSRDGEPLRRLRKRLARLQYRITHDAANVETMYFEMQHRARKRLKRLRYVAAFLAPLYAPRDVAAWLKAVKRAQEALGRHVDLLTAARRFEAMAVTLPASWFAVGWLKREACTSARESRQCLQSLAHLGVFW